MTSTYERVKSFNERCNKSPKKIGTPEYYEDLVNQMARIEEELNELNRAIDITTRIRTHMAHPKMNKEFTMHGFDVIVNEESLKYWEQEILDAGADLDVVVSGFNYVAGHDYEGAIGAVMDENHTKYTLNVSFAEESMVDLKRKNPEHDFEVQSFIEDDVTYYSVHRCSDNKICKLLWHPKVDLSPFVKN